METMNENKMYPVHCTECGELIEGKFFPLKKLLEQYYFGTPIETKRAQLIETLGIGAMFGQSVLPSVPPLLRKKSGRVEEDYEDDAAGYMGMAQNYEFVDSNFGKIAARSSDLNVFACENNEIPGHLLKPVELNIASIVAQFALMSGFDTIYYMLALWNKIEMADRMGDEIDFSERYQLNTWCEEFLKLPGVKVAEMGQAQQRIQEVYTILSIILEFAREEADRPGQRHFATEEISIGWRYKIVNNRKMPFSLVVQGNSGNIYHATDCCCDKCHRALAYEMGAYRQKLVGILGTQATGKTTYLTALTDAIDLGEATSMIQSNGESRRARVTIQHSMVSDPQWKRAVRPPVGAEAAAEDPLTAAAAKAGSVWLYKHGYPPEKTDMKMLEAPALSFLISGEDKDGKPLEPVMYTLADIPGEAFSNAAEEKQDQLLVEKQHRLLFSCSALIVVVSSRQLLRQEDSTAGEGVAKDALISDPNVILGCYKDFMPDHAIPTAVVLTAADEINNGNLRRPMQLGFDLRTCPALVWSGRQGALVYNAELMKTADTAVKEYLNKNFGEFMENLSLILQEKGGEVTIGAFAASSGTQCAPRYYSASSDDEYHSDKQMEARYHKMRQARFGVATPLLWMLACDGLLDVGRGDNAYNDYSRDVQAKIQKRLKKGLYT